MTLDYVLVPAGIILLGVPATVIATAKVREKMRSPARRREDGFKSLGRLAFTPINWIDFVRAGAGAWMIQHSLSPASSGQDDLAMAYLAVKLAIIILCAGAQTIWLDRPIRVVGPLFYMTAFSLVVCGPLVAGFALPLGFGVALMLRRLSLIFALVPAGLLGFSGLFGQLDLPTMAVSAAFALPAFLSFALHIRIAFACRPTEATPAVPAANPESPVVAGENVISTDFARESFEITDGFVA